MCKCGTDHFVCDEVVRPELDSRPMLVLSGEEVYSIGVDKLWHSGAGHSCDENSSIRTTRVAVSSTFAEHEAVDDGRDTCSILSNVNNKGCAFSCRETVVHSRVRLQNA